MIVSVRLFAGLRELAGTDRVEVEVGEEARVADVLAAMARTPVGPVEPSSCVVAVNREYADASVRVYSGDEIALVPPVSGGEGEVRHVEISEEPLELSILSSLAHDPAAGGVVIFEGTTREVPELHYEAYKEMAERRMRQIAEEEVRRHGLCAVALAHRVGVVPLAEPSVIIAASAPHRGEAFEGARAILDRIKAEAPIWKVEVEEDGSSNRVAGTLPPLPDRP